MPLASVTPHFLGRLAGESVVLYQQPEQPQQQLVLVSDCNDSSYSRSMESASTMLRGAPMMVAPPPPPPPGPPPRRQPGRTSSSTKSSRTAAIQQEVAVTFAMSSPKGPECFAAADDDSSLVMKQPWQQQYARQELSKTSLDPPEEADDDDLVISSPESSLHNGSHYSASRRLFVDNNWTGRHETEKKQDDDDDDVHDNDNTVGDTFQPKDLDMERAKQKQQHETDKSALVYQLRQQLALVEQQAVVQEQSYEKDATELRLLVDNYETELGKLQALLAESNNKLLVMGETKARALADSMNERDQAHEQALRSAHAKEQALQQQLQALQAADVSVERHLNADLMGQLQRLQAENARLQADLEEAHDGIVQLQQTKEQDQEEANETIRTLQADKRQLHEQLQEYIASAHESSLRNRDAPPTTDDLESLRRQLAATRHEQERTEETLDHKQAQLENLRNALEDRDYTIAKLMRSSVALEKQVKSYKYEVSALRSKRGTGQGEGYDIIMMEDTSKDKVAQLCADLESCKQVEKELSQENTRLKDDAAQMFDENTSLKLKVDELSSELDLLCMRLGESEKELGLLREKDLDVMSNTGTEISATPQVQIQERDKAIASLLERSMEQEQTISDLSSQLKAASEGLESLRVEKEELSRSGPSWEEVKQLRSETEMYAEQVIEQEEEIETLTRFLKSREDKINALGLDVNELRAELIVATENSTTSIANLSSKMDESEAANQQLQDEIRRLKKEQNELMEAKNKAIRSQDVEAQSTLEQFKQQISDLSKEKVALETALATEGARKSIIDHLDEKLLSLEAQLKERDAQLKQKETQLALLEQLPKCSSVDEMEVDSLRSEINNLKRNLAHQTDELDKAKATISELEREVAEKDSSATTNLNEEKEELMVEVESLSYQLEESRAEVNTLSEIVDNYELKLRLIAQDKDVTIDNLTRALAAEKEETTGELDHMRREVEMTLAEMTRLKEEVTNEVNDRDERIIGLQQALTAHRDLVEQMKTEMDHLQSSMETRAVNRRDEIEDMQQELVDLTSTVAHQERQIKSLIGEIQDKKVEHAAEIEKLKREMEQVENASEQLGYKHRNALDLQMEGRLSEVRGQIEKLQRRNNVLQEENAELRRKLVSEALRISSATASATAAETSAGEASNKLHEDLEAQTQRVKNLEVELEQLKKLTPKLEPASSELTVPIIDVTRAAMANPVLWPSTSATSGPPSSPSINPAGRRQRGMGFLSRSQR